MGQHVKKITDPADLEKALAVRRQVFIEEQQVPEEIEIDQYDQEMTTQHLLAFDHDGNPVGTARFRPYGDGVCKVERVAVLQSQRGTGIGKRIMEAIENEAKQAGYHTLKLNAQTHAQRFYEKLGYEAVGETFMEADIEHVTMIKRLNS